MTPIRYDKLKFYVAQNAIDGVATNTFTDWLLCETEVYAVGIGRWVRSMPLDDGFASPVVGSGRETKHIFQTMLVLRGFYAVVQTARWLWTGPPLIRPIFARQTRIMVSCVHAWRAIWVLFNSNWY